MSPECTGLKERTDGENRSASQIGSERQAWRLESLNLEIIQNLLKKGERKHVRAASFCVCTYMLQKSAFLSPDLIRYMSR